MKKKPQQSNHMITTLIQSSFALSQYKVSMILTIDQVLEKVEMAYCFGTNVFWHVGLWVQDPNHHLSGLPVQMVNSWIANDENNSPILPSSFTLHGRNEGAKSVISTTNILLMAFSLSNTVPLDVIFMWAVCELSLSLPLPDQEKVNAFFSSSFQCILLLNAFTAPKSENPVLVSFKTLQRSKSQERRGQYIYGMIGWSLFSAPRTFVQVGFELYPILHSYLFWVFLNCCYLYWSRFCDISLLFTLKED